MKNKALSAFMATAITAILVLPVSHVNAASNDSSLNRSIQIDAQVAAAKTKGQTVTITSITKDKVLTSNGQFKISHSLKHLFDTANSTALKNAQATIAVKNGEITSVTALTLTKAGTKNNAVYFDGGDAQIEGSLTVNADYVKVQNVTIEDELIVTNRVKKAITIDDVTIGDTITFRPLLTRNSNWLNVSLKDMQSPNINLKRTKVSVTSDKTISKVEVVGKVTAFEVTANVDKLTIDVEKDFSLYGKGKIEQVVVKHGAKVALNSGHLINNVQVDDKKASVSLPVLNKTELSNLVASPPYVAVSVNGYDVLTTEKWTTQAERTTFESAVSSARAVVNNSYASQEQVRNAITQYKTALNVYQAVQKNGTKYVYGDKSSLQSIIYSVQYVTVSWNNGNDVASYVPWTTQSEKDALTSAVSSAQYVVNNNYATQSDIINAINNLNYAITVYKNVQKYGTYQTNVDRSALFSLINSVQYVTVSVNGSELSSNVIWTTQSEKDALVSAVSYAQGIANNSSSSQSDISSAYYYLNNAISTYRSNYKSGTNYWHYVDKSWLASLINSVQYVKVSENGDGSDIPYYELWTTEREKRSLEKAVQHAQSVVNNVYASSFDVTDAINKLNKAIDIYKDAQRSGKQ
ncbi:S-layer protein [Lysinibacillus xylanilyticus]|uniref:S-layer protein n=1 Tax=Lysinibacillus xylanilyticus TaxID=582475 RepID=UPI002B2533FF|nr:S-layer protein [Lysinibacillus xylanilyticus]MEB2301837.1 S-layer protein [Lysinibacillus xylanilyticus]